jgi:hypothetical protein
MRVNEPVSPRSALRAASIIDIILGIWVLISPWVLVFIFPAQLWNNVAVGGLIVILSGIQASAPLKSLGISWLNFLLGLWLIISGFVMGPPAQPTFFWNQVILGIVVAIASIWGTAGNPAVDRPVV